MTTPHKPWELCGERENGLDQVGASANLNEEAKRLSDAKCCLLTRHSEREFLWPYLQGTTLPHFVNGAISFVIRSFAFRCVTARHKGLRVNFVFFVLRHRITL